MYAHLEEVLHQQHRHMFWIEVTTFFLYGHKSTGTSTLIQSLKWAEVLISKVIQHGGYFFSCMLIIFICCSLCCCGSFISKSKGETRCFTYFKFSSATRLNPIHLVLNNKVSSSWQAIQLCDIKEYKTSAGKLPKNLKSIYILLTTAMVCKRMLPGTGHVMSQHDWARSTQQSSCSDLFLCGRWDWFKRSRHQCSHIWNYLLYEQTCPCNEKKHYFNSHKASIGINLKFAYDIVKSGVCALVLLSLWLQVPPSSCLHLIHWHCEYKIRSELQTSASGPSSRGAVCVLCICKEGVDCLFL